jgi:hypothetical protein
MNRLIRIAAALGFTVGAVLLGGVGASADHAGETLTASKTDGLNDGDTVTVTFANFNPAGKPVKVVIAGQGKLTTIPDKLNFDEYAVAPTANVGSGGGGSVDIIVVADHGTVQDGTTLDCKTQQCWIIAVQEPFLPQPNYASVPITFAGGSVAAATTAPPTAAPDTTAVPAETTTTLVEETTTTEVEATTTTTEVVADDAAASEEDGGGSGLTYAIIAVVAALAAGAGYYFTRRTPPPA